MKKVMPIRTKRKPKLTTKEKYPTSDLQAKSAKLQALFPLGLMKVAEELEEEVEQLAGARYGRQGGKPGHYRWGSEERSIYLADQKIRTVVPRVRNSKENKEIAVTTMGPVLKRCLRLLDFLPLRSPGALAGSVPLSARSWRKGIYRDTTLLPCSLTARALLKMR